MTNSIENNPLSAIGLMFNSNDEIYRFAVAHKLYNNSNADDCRVKDYNIEHLQSNNTASWLLPLPLHAFKHKQWLPILALIHKFNLYRICVHRQTRSPGNQQ